MSIQGSVAIELKGVKKFLTRLGLFPKLLNASAIEGIKVALLLVEGEAKKITPVDKGNLINSYSTGVIFPGGVITGFIKNDAYYAVYVHEMPSTNKFTKPGTGPKFLSRPLFENQAKIAMILARYGKKGLVKYGK